ncbi:MAG: hypothetical protein R3C01_02065 [Planctomycetaceae bacterium]
MAGTEAIQEINMSGMVAKSDIVRLEHTIEQLELPLTLKLGTLMTGGIAFLEFLKNFG